MIQLKKKIYWNSKKQSFIDDLLIFVTAPAASQVLLDETDVTLRDDGDDDITTEEPLLKKCIVDGKFYSHSQTVMTNET